MDIEGAIIGLSSALVVIGTIGVLLGMVRWIGERFGDKGVAIFLLGFVIFGMTLVGAMGWIDHG